jgi:hypothetical protein
VVNSLNASELLEILSKLWASTEDIKKIGCVGKNKALKIKNEIRNQMVDDNMVFPRYLVSMEYVKEYFKIDEDKLRIQAGGVVNG